MDRNSIWFLILGSMDVTAESETSSWSIWTVISIRVICHWRSLDGWFSANVGFPWHDRLVVADDRFLPRKPLLYTERASARCWRDHSPGKALKLAGRILEVAPCDNAVCAWKQCIVTDLGWLLYIKIKPCGVDEISCKLLANFGGTALGTQWPLDDPGIL